MKCYVNAPGCEQHFVPKKHNSTICSNPECKRIHVNKLARKWKERHPENILKWKEVQKSLEEPVKRVRRVCIGKLCRGEKTFWSEGNRLCKHCQEAIKHMEDGYSHVSGRKSGS